MWYVGVGCGVWCVVPIAIRVVVPVVALVLVSPPNLQRSSSLMASRLRYDRLRVCVYQPHSRPSPVRRAIKA